VIDDEEDVKEEPKIQKVKSTKDEIDELKSNL
jgi:hypothetical protein